MAIWNKKEISREVVKELHDRFGCDVLTASILARRNIIEGRDAVYFLENELRFLSSPFDIHTMEDAVDRILAAKEEGEKILIFGDRDVDGITSTTVLYDYLKEIGADVQWRLPSGDDSYGLSIKAVDDFASQYGTLIITVDCGISNNEEIDHAARLGIDVIVVDHHNPPEDLPEASVIVNPKMKNSGCAFVDISGCAVVYKLVSALRFAQTDEYKIPVCLMNVRPVNDSWIIEAVKVENMSEKGRISEMIVPGLVSISQTRLPSFFSGQAIYVWDAPLQKKLLDKIFGKSIEFNFVDIRPQIVKKIPAAADASLLRLKDMSKIAKYRDTPPSELDGFFNIYISYIQNIIDTPEKKAAEERDLQLVMLAALADIMPMKNENRILVKRGIQSMNAGPIRKGLQELTARLGTAGKRITSTEISWNVIPPLNAAGRLGQPEAAAELLLADDAQRREELAATVISLNQDRKALGSDAWVIAQDAAFKSLERYHNNLVLTADERINRGVTGIVASRLAQFYKVPAFVITFLEDGTAVGSVRSARGYDITGLLDQCADLFINHGGHNFAAGFSFTMDKLAEFSVRLEKAAPFIELPPVGSEEIFTIDAELPSKYMTADILKIVDAFEPYGEENPPLVFSTSRVKITDADIMGRKERVHLKLTLRCGDQTWPALYWNAAAKLGTEFSAGDTVDAVFNISRNNFNGVETPQLIILDLKRST